jgi:DUF4097 and DUF4098 domain-containing protein YvlB
MRTVYLLSALLALALSAAAHGEADFEKSVPAAPNGAVEISNVSGSVEVSGWDRPEVAVHGDLGSGVERVDVTTEGNRIRIKVVLPSFSMHGGSADLKIQLPKGSELTVSAVSADVTASNVLGPQHLTAVSGNVTSELGDREVELKTVSGDVRLKGRGKGTSLRVTTVSGDMHLEHVTGDIELGTVSGGVTATLDGARSLRAHSTSGDLRFEGSLARGASVEANTVSGELTVRASADGGFRYEVSTFSGDIGDCFEQKAERTSQYAPGKSLQGTRGEGSGEWRLKTMSGDLQVCDHR